jgi:hypothetical protein
MIVAPFFLLEENIGDSFPDAGYTFIDPSGVQGFKDFFTTIAPAHDFFLKIRCFL